MPSKRDERNESEWLIKGFSLSRFESELRRILCVADERFPGTPGGAFPPIDIPPAEFSKRYLIGMLMSKYDDGSPDPSKDRVAMEKFEEAEENCFWRNLYFSQGKTAVLSQHSTLRRAAWHIQELLGDVLDLNRVARGFGWGPGASTRLPKRRGDSSYKYSGPPEVTPNAYSLGVAAMMAVPGWIPAAGVAEPVCVFGSKLTTVPKNYKTNRTIAVEPDLNMYLQKGLGSLLRKKLKSVGVDLDDQGLNREACKLPGYATIDFSMASDSVSQGLVSVLLPDQYADFIASTRSELIVYPDGTIHRLNKVSSMGNGYTFELESLIFWALALASLETCTPVGASDGRRVYVYGDDVILPEDAVEEFLAVCKIAGLNINTEKSFWSGPFRESCGIHMHSGHDVTPFYVRRPVLDLQELFLLHNNLLRWIRRNDALLSRIEYDALQRLLAKLRSLAPSRWRRPRLPDGFGDGAFVGSFASCNPQTHPGGWEHFLCQILAHDREVVQCGVPGLLVKSMYNLERRRTFKVRLQLPGSDPETLAFREATGGVWPSHDGQLAPQYIAVPWSAWG